MKKLILLFSLFLACNSFASFEGKWTGTFYLDNTPCDAGEFYIEKFIDNSGVEYIDISGYINCLSNGRLWANSVIESLEIDGENLLSFGSIVGSITDTTINILDTLKIAKLTPSSLYMEYHSNNKKAIATLNNR